MEYPPKLKKVVENSLNNVIEMVKERKGPFNTEVVLKYFEDYKKVNNKL
jgi:protein associated with RNAse G/E